MSMKSVRLATRSRPRGCGNVILAAAVLILGSSALHAQSPIDTTILCPRSNGAGSLQPGHVLFKVDIDTTVFPDAICNDGTGAILYVRRASTAADRDKWHIYLQGGGACNTYEGCSDRWCHANQNFGRDKMTTDLSPAGVDTNGLFSRDSSNFFATWNHVLIYYCSSDTWLGTKSDQVLSDDLGNSYTLSFRGADILDAAYRTLTRQNGIVYYTDDPDSMPYIPMPDLHDASHILFSGTSAGAAGLRHWVDQVVSDILRVDLQSCTDPRKNCRITRMRALMDANFQPPHEDRDWAASTRCAANPSYCTYEGAFQNDWNVIFSSLYGARVDASCLEYHTTIEPGTEWRCADADHVLLNHVTTPYFIRQDTQDAVLGANYVGTNFGTWADFGSEIAAQVADLVNVDLGEEGTAIAGLIPVGYFVPQCTQHEAIESRRQVFGTEIADSTGTLHNLHDTLVNWLRGNAPSTLAEPFDPAILGKLPGCP